VHDGHRFPFGNAVDSADDMQRAVALHARLSNENAQLTRRIEAEAAARTRANTEAASVRVDPLEAVIKLRRQGAFVRVWLLSEGKVTSAFAALFGLSKQDVAALEDAIGKARERVGQLSAASAVVNQMDQSTYLVTVKPLPQAADIQKELFANFERVLGPERQALFLELDGGLFPSTEANFGAAERIFTIKRLDHPDPNGVAIKLKEQVTNPSGSVSNNNAQVSDWAFLPQYKWLEPLLPANFRSKR